MNQQRRPVGQGVRKAANRVTLDHKIKLKKRLAKAYKKYDQQDPDQPELPEPEMVESIETALHVPARQKFITATKAPYQGRAPHVQHQLHKPDPLKAAREAQARAEAERAAEQLRRDTEIAEIQRRKAESQQARRDKKKKMTARTKKGQPVLSNQIDNLLAKIQSNYS